MRADSLDQLTERGWEQVAGYGIRTVIDLRNPDERGEATGRPGSVAVVELPLDGVENEDFWAGWRERPEFGTPAYYRTHVESFPELTANVIDAIADAPEGGVVFHCVGGRDRTGQIAMALLELAGVRREAIVADYAASADRIRAHSPERGPELDEIEALFERGPSLGELIDDLLEGVDLRSQLEAAGLPADACERLRARLR